MIKRTLILEKIFNLLRCTVVAAAVFCFIFVLPVGAADNGCDKEQNDKIVPELALCSTHAYNIGATQNPSGADKQLMKDVVALKTTVMAQQMNKQYEYLEAMIRRFKIQLEKAVLTTGLEAKGAASTSSSSSGNSGFKSNDRNIFMAGVKNCNNELLPTDVMTCLNANMNTISNMSSNADNISMELRKQLENDFKLLVNTYPTETSDGKAVGCNTTSDTNKVNCLDYKKITKKKDFQECFDNMRSCLRNKSYALSQAAQQKKQ